MSRGEQQLLPAAIQILERAGAIIHGGDFSTLSALEYLRTFAPVYAVHGNVDESELVGLLPLRLEVELESQRFGVVHDPARPRAGSSGFSVHSPTAT